MQLTDITFKLLISVVAFAVLGIEIYNKIYTAKKNLKADQQEKAKPVLDIKTRLDQYDTWFAADKKRLEALESEIKVNKTENRLMMKALLALTRHGIDGNNIEGLKHIRDEVQEYLVDK